MVNQTEKIKLENLPQQFLDALEQVGEARAKLSGMENILEDFCQEIKKLGFDFANISLISQEQNTIESVHGIGIGKQWSSCPKHYLETDPELRDIQADIIATRRTEIISGWDKRFDRWVYEEYGHEKIVRVFTPILVVEDDDGKLIENWFEHCLVKPVDFQPEANGERQGQHQIYQMCPVENGQLKGRNPEFTPIGTVEAGYDSSNTKIEPEKLKELLKCIAKWSLCIWKVQLPRVLETIAEIARTNLNADAATLHFLYEPDRQPKDPYIYNVFSGRFGKKFLEDCPPRKDGLGRRAIQEKKYKFISNQPNGYENWTIEKFNPTAFTKGIRAMVAFPLLFDGQEGVLYVLFLRQHEFVEPLLDSVNKLVQRCAVDAISDSARIQQMRDKIRWQTLQSITQSLSNLQDSNVLRRIAWNTLNMLGADVVNIYEYVQIENGLITPPNTAGRLKEKKEVQEIGETNLLSSLIKGGNNVYASRLKDTIFENSSFSIRERIESTAGILLKVDNQDIVAVMFINYRRLHDFSDDEKKIIERLAESAASAIQNYRWLTSRKTINRLIITTIDQEKLLELITREASKITGADVAGIYLFDSSKKEVLTKSVYNPSPNDIKPNSSEDRFSINRGIIGWVIENRKSALVENVQRDKRYFSGFENIKSELCVPLLDKEDNVFGVLIDKEDNVFGVLNVESQRIAAFNERHQKILEDLANQAVIGMQGWRNKERLLNMKKIIALNNLASSVVHRMNNYIGAIRSLSQEIIDHGNESQSNARQIFATAEQIMQGINGMTWNQEQPQPVNLLSVLDSILEKMTRGVAPSSWD
jgi:GAF domain-containing protein